MATRGRGIVSTVFKMAVVATLPIASTAWAEPPRPTTAPSAGVAATPPAFGRYVPERKDDIGWENDRIAFRVYGPRLEKDEPPPLSGSGIDVWAKSTRRPVINDWYQGGDYHVDHGDGLDYFNVGASRGCGGLGVWAGGKLHVSGAWKTHRFTQQVGDNVSFELTYAPWDAGGRKVSEKRTITLTAGSNLNRIESTIDSDTPGDLVVGIGVTRDPVKGSRQEPHITRINDRGVLSAWSAADAKNGSMGYGVVVDPATVVGFERDPLNDLILVKVTPGKPFVYYAGACWSKGLDFASRDAWEAYLTTFKPGR